jgi:hypothetical protein
MKVQHRVAIWCGSLLFLGMLMAGFLVARAQQGKNNRYICSETHPGSVCNATTTCGSASLPCVVDIKRRGGTSASSTPDIPNAKGNAPFCVKVGTTVTCRPHPRIRALSWTSALLHHSKLSTHPVRLLVVPTDRFPLLPKSRAVTNTPWGLAFPEVSTECVDLRQRRSSSPNDTCGRLLGSYPRADREHDQDQS